MDAAALARRIDHAFLKVDSGASVNGLRAAVELVQRAGLRSLCVPPLLAGTVKKNFPAVRVSAVVSYPLGADTLAAKVFACSELIEQRVEELDVVLDLFALVNDNRRKVELEAKELIALTKPAGVVLKCIIEAPILSDAQLRWATDVLCGAGVDFVKTGTGYGRPAVTVDQVRLIKATAASRAKVKASGGIRTLYDAQALLDAGADVLGVSGTAKLLAEVSS
jgi:deoxyribose-phosphate aldolase